MSEVQDHLQQGPHTTPDHDEDTPTRPGYPLGVPSKFDPEGNVQPFPGNTVIAHLPPMSHLYNDMVELHAKLAAHPTLSSLIVLLPPESWHMTIFEGVCDQVRDAPGFWPSDVSQTAPLADVNALLAQRLAPGTFDLQEHYDQGPPYVMTVKGFSPLIVGIGLHVEPISQTEGRRLKALRDRLADTLKIRHPHHDYYELHLSVAYLLRHLTPRQEAELTALLEFHYVTMSKHFLLGPPEFCTFKDMFKFERKFYLQ
ncbi:DUF1868-domain-containing protein [Diplogelasinospora grovesii]|uniref:DUF1868-domain-containing protein n=1 Tax=Diplogelasinospora grovesii TaxID=303347 RepID=A0AAN6S5D7_9PEZI|nr:DUF1868-domain-containing protein [Diplogelasinospora grovesii]